jgi:hypothetical protein
MFSTQSFMLSLVSGFPGGVRLYYDRALECKGGDRGKILLKGKSCSRVVWAPEVVLIKVADMTVARVQCYRIGRT